MSQDDARTSLSLDFTATDDLRRTFRDLLHELQPRPLLPDVQPVRLK